MMNPSTRQQTSFNRRRQPTVSPTLCDSTTDSPSTPATHDNSSSQSTSSMKRAYSAALDMQQPGMTPISSVAGLRILIAIATIVGVPIVFYDFHLFPGPTLVGSLLVQIKNVWDALLRLDMIQMAAFALCVSIYIGSQCNLNGCSTAAAAAAAEQQNSADSCLLVQDPLCTPWANKISLATCGIVPVSSAQNFLKRLRSAIMTVDGLALMLALGVGLFTAVTKSFPILMPSWVFYPFALFDYKVYPTAQLVPMVKGICPDLTPQQRMFQPQPLCLGEESWEFLSSGVLSPHNAQDVQTVYSGMDYIRHESGGLAIAVLARDIKHRIPAFRDNIEALSYIFKDLALVVFENDSSDGSREALREWAADDKKNDPAVYKVELLESEEVPECKFGTAHRDWDTGDFTYSKAVGDMDKYRQRVTDHITDSPQYEGYSHMLVTDIDLGISMSPLGIVHALGKHQHHAVVASGRFLLPDGYGRLRVPYDFSAFMPKSIELNNELLSRHEQWCAVMPPGTRWRNICDAPSPMMLSEMIRVDRGLDGDFYEVESAFNGAVLYPLDVVKQTHATYDAGEDGQRCEHIGFNLGLRKTMYVDRKWNMHLDPKNPGGPTGWRAHNVFQYVGSIPRLIVPLYIIHLSAYFSFLHSFITLGVFLVYPLVSPIWAYLRSMMGSHHKRRRFFSAAKTAEKSSKEETLFKIV